MQALERDISQIEEIEAVARDLKRALEQLPGWAGTRVEEVLRLTPERAVVVIRRRDEYFVLKQFFGEKGPARATLMAEALGHAAHMQDGAYRVVPLVASYATQGIVIMARTPGLRMDRILADAVSETRLRLVGAAGHWLARYTEPTRAEGRFYATFWLRQIEDLPHRHMQGDARELSFQILDKMARMAPDLNGRAVIRARSHGDFVDRNLNVAPDGETLWGFDIDRYPLQPVARDAARFLTWRATDGIGHPAKAGLPRDEVSAMAATDLLPQEEWHDIVPFFAGETLIRRFADRMSDMDRLVPAARAWLA
ncbi:hypothetical protein ABEB22_05725 [Thioclava sp. 'Guangxiensis']|uniref:hypothetical protein n=1 Tax=Thioclava sp. 'Guangxiensis' TaxID=3149044 RepID=UPI00387814A7